MVFELTPLLTIYCYLINFYMFLMHSAFQQKSIDRGLEYPLTIYLGI